MDAAAFMTLVAFWLRQYLPFLLRTIASTAALALIFAATGNADRELISALLVGTAFVYGIPPALFMFQHRASGDLEMITALPVMPSTIALSLVAAAGVLVVPGAVSLAVGTGIGLDLIGVARPPFVPLLVGGWIVLWLIAWVFVAMSAALDARAFMNGPVAATGLLILSTAVLPDPDPSRLIAWMGSPRFLLVLALAATFLILVVAWGCFALTCRGLRRYEGVTQPMHEPGWRFLQRRQSATPR